MTNLATILRTLLDELDEAHDKKATTCPDDDNFWIAGAISGPTMKAFRDAVEKLRAAGIDDTDLDDEEDENLPACGTHCPDDSCPGVIEDDAGNCSHCGLDYQDDEDDEPLLDIGYRCPVCGEQWEEQWSCACDSECPRCETSDITALRWKGQDEEWPALAPEHVYVPNVGDKRKLPEPQIDDDDGVERTTSAGSIVEIVRIVPKQDACFLVGCPLTGGSWFFTLDELLTETEPV